MRENRTGSGQQYNEEKPKSAVGVVKEKHVSEGETELLTAKRSRRQDFPTPESPMSRSLNK